MAVVVHKSPITTHILDTARGRPAQNVPVTLAKQSDVGQWVTLGSGYRETLITLKLVNIQSF